MSEKREIDDKRFQLILQRKNTQLQCDFYGMWYNKDNASLLRIRKTEDTI